jgi:hypothetical protein
LLLLVQLNFIDALPLEAQNIPLDVDSHCPVLCKVSEALYTNRLRGDRHPFSLIEPEKSRFDGVDPDSTNDVCDRISSGLT